MKRARPWSGAVQRAVPLVAVLLVASAGILSATFFTGQAVRTLSLQSLESTARGISLAAEQVLREEEGRTLRFERLFSDHVVAYALIADRDGTVLFHTNPDLRGSSFEDPPAFARLEMGAASSRRALLGTGRPVLLYDRLLLRAGGSPALLRLALHTIDADRMSARVGRLWWSVGAVLALLWAAGGLVLLLSARSEALRRRGERREALALVGQMTATLAHEIRNAVGGVKGYAQLAAERTADGDPRAQHLATVLRGVARIEQIVSDLLLFSREERFSLADLDPAPILSAAVSATASWNGRAELDLEPGLRVRADAEKLERIVANGVQNAVQAMGETGSLRVSARRQGDRVAIRIEDSGCGIPTEELPRLFTPFYTTKATGTGLGLAYARKAVEGMNGTISLGNREDAGGATLTLLLPRAEY